MTRIVNTYTSSNGTEYSLREFLTSQLYHPNTVREVKRSNAEYYDAIAADKKRVKLEEAQAAKPKVLSDDDRFAIAVANKKRQDDERQAYADREAEKERMHQEYLNSTPELATISTTSFYIYTLEVHQWMAKGYQLVVESLNCLAPSYFEATLTAPPAASKKK